MPRKSTTTGITTEERRVRSERLRSRLLGICEGFEAGASVDVKDLEDQISRLEADNEGLRKELYGWKAKHFEDCGKAKLSGYEEGRKEAAREAFQIALEVQKEYSGKSADAASLAGAASWNDVSTGAMRVKQAISKHFGLDAKPEEK